MDIECESLGNERCECTLVMPLLKHVQGGSNMTGTDCV